jgi:hypothetical protein
MVEVRGMAALTNGWPHGACAIHRKGRGEEPFRDARYMHSETECVHGETWSTHAFFIHLDNAKR